MTYRGEIGMMRQRVAGWIPMLATALVLLTAGRGGLRAADSVETADTANSSALDFSDLSESIGRTVEPFELEDFRGKEHSLSAVPDERLTVVAFFGIECPLARLYAPRLAEVAGEFESRGVRFLVVDGDGRLPASLRPRPAVSQRPRQSFGGSDWRASHAERLCT
jgi:thiol-disulfide isomerase/thioredoxin